MTDEETKELLKTLDYHFDEVFVHVDKRLKGEHQYALDNVIINIDPPLSQENDVFVHSIKFWPKNYKKSIFVVSDKEQSHTRQIGFDAIMLLLEDYEIETLFCDLIFLACKYFVDKRITTDGDYTFSLQGFANVSFTYDFDEIFVDDEEKECWI